MKCLIATPTRPVVIYYCKAGIQSGRTIRLLQGGEVFEAAAIEIVGDVHATMSHDNSTGKPKRSGARCVMNLNKGTVMFT